jgi:hypothetical protein
MKRLDIKIYVLVLFFVQVCVGASSKIVEIKNLIDAEKYIDKETFLILDLDRTLVFANGNPVESGITQTIKKLSQKAKNMISITARPQTSHKISSKQMSNLGIVFDNFKLPKYNFNCSALLPCRFHEGILSIGGSSKGKAFLSFIDIADHKVTKIVLIDDLKKNLKTMQEAAKKLDVPYVGIWYTRV